MAGSREVASEPPGWTLSGDLNQAASRSQPGSSGGAIGGRPLPVGQLTFAAVSAGLVLGADRQITGLDDRLSDRSQLHMGVLRLVL
jgi:hypothetical protein